MTGKRLLIAVAVAFWLVLPCIGLLVFCVYRYPDDFLTHHLIEAAVGHIVFCGFGIACGVWSIVAYRARIAIGWHGVVWAAYLSLGLAYSEVASAGARYRDRDVAEVRDRMTRLGNAIAVYRDQRMGQYPTDLEQLDPSPLPLTDFVSYRLNDGAPPTLTYRTWRGVFIYDFGSGRWEMQD